MSKQKKLERRVFLKQVAGVIGAAAQMAPLTDSMGAEILQAGKKRLDHPAV